MTQTGFTQHPTRTAVVLGGGGSTGNAWLIGVCAGLLDAGVDVTHADLTVGTSAGSTAAAQMVGASPTDLYAAILATAPKNSVPPGGSTHTRAHIQPVVDHLERMRRLISASEDAADLRRRIGAAALELDAASDGSWPLIALEATCRGSRTPQMRHVDETRGVRH